MRKLVFFIAMMIVLSACETTQNTVAERNATVQKSTTKSNFYEYRQMLEIEEWKDIPGKPVNAYIFIPNGDVLTVRCKGVPTSSTESNEPNYGWTGYTLSYGFNVPQDGADVYTTEQAGRDGTFGEPVPFRQCMSVDGQYYDWSAIGGLPVLITSAAYTFESPTTERDLDTEVKLLQVQTILARGGCVDADTFEEIKCAGE